MKEKKVTFYKKNDRSSKSYSSLKINPNTIKANKSNIKIKHKRCPSIKDFSSQMGEMDTYIEELYKKYKDTKKQRQMKEENEKILINRINYLTVEEKKLRMDIEKMQKYKNKNAKSLSTTNINYYTNNCNTMNNYKKSSSLNNSYIDNEINNSVDLLNNSGSLVTNNICIIINRNNEKNDNNKDKNNKNNNDKTENNNNDITDDSAITAKRPIKIFRKRKVKCPCSLIYDTNYEKNNEKIENFKKEVLESEDIKKDDIQKNYNSNKETEDENISPSTRLNKKIEFPKSVSHNNYNSPKKISLYKKNESKYLKSFIHKKIPLYTKVNKKQKTNSVKLNSSNKKYFDKFSTNTSKRSLYNKKIGTFKQLIDSKKNLLGLKTDSNLNIFKEFRTNFSNDKPKENLKHNRNISLDNSYLNYKFGFKTNENKSNTNKQFETAREGTLKLNPTIYYSPNTNRDNNKKNKVILVKRIHSNKKKKTNDKIIGNHCGEKNMNNNINNEMKDTNKIIIQNFFINANNNKVGNNNKIMENKLLLNTSINDANNPNFIKEEISVIRRINLKIANMKKNYLLNRDSKNNNKKK